MVFSHFRLELYFIRRLKNFKITPVLPSLKIFFEDMTAKDESQVKHCHLSFCWVGFFLACFRFEEEGNILRRSPFRLKEHFHYFELRLKEWIVEGKTEIKDPHRESDIPHTSLI